MCECLVLADHRECCLGLNTQKAIVGMTRASCTLCPPLLPVPATPIPPAASVLPVPVMLGGKSCCQNNPSSLASPCLHCEAPCAAGQGKEAHPWGAMERHRFYLKLCCRPTQRLWVWRCSSPNVSRAFQAGGEQLLSQLGPVAKTLLGGGDSKSRRGSSPEAGMPPCW